MGNWYRRDVDVALEDMLALTPEEHGIYDRVVLLIHRRGGAVPDDDAFVAGWCRCDPRIWRRVRARLIALEKLYVDDGLRSPLADPEIAETRRRQVAAQAAGRASALSRRTGASEINSLATTPVAAVTPPLAPEGPPAAGTPELVRAEAEAAAGIAAHLDRKSPFALQDMVAALLQATGYLTRVSPPGADGGTDVLAWRDPLGPPGLRVQVRHRTAPVSRDAVAALRGVLRGEERGLFVSLSGFTPEAVREAQGEKPIRLIDRDDFVALWIRHADTLPDAARDMMRLKAVYFLDRRYSAMSSATSRFGAECVIAPDER